MGGFTTENAFRLFENVAVLYRTKLLKPLWGQYPLREKDPWLALAIFMEGYAFEHQAVARDYVFASVDAMRTLQASGKSVSDPAAPSEAWHWFKEALEDSGLKGLNESNNPLCPQGTHYGKKNRRTRGLSAVEFCGFLADESQTPNLLAWTNEQLRIDVELAHRQLRNAPGMNGIAEKIASFWFRDVADWYEIAPKRDRHLLQPVDIWVRRAVNYLMGRLPKEARQLTDMGVARWIVDRALNFGANPERVNQGMWYLGSQVCVSHYRLRNVLDNPALAEELIQHHLRGLRAAADTGWPPS